MKSCKKSFTLVELIIVIAIIAILAVTAFLMLTKWISKSRDSARLSDLNTIDNALQISLTEKSTLPKPENYTLIYASGTANIIGYQGDFGDNIAKSLGNLNSAPKDAMDNLYYTYYLDSTSKQYQLLGYTENLISSVGNTANAVDYSARFVKTAGSELGILVDSNNAPINKLGLTGVDVALTTGAYTAYFNNSEKINGTGFILKSLRGGGNLGYGLVGYWSFDEGSGTVVYDNSGKGNNGILSGAILPVWTGGKVGSGMYFNSGYVIIPNKDYFYSSKITISAKFNISSYSTSLVGGAILGNDNGAGYGGGGFELRIPSDKVFNGAFWNSLIGTGTWDIIRSNDLMLLSQRTSVTIVLNGTNVYLYINGNLISSVKVLHNGKYITDGQLSFSSLNNGLNLYIGSSSFQSNQRGFNGIIDEVRIYNRALSDSEVQLLYNATK